MRARRRLHRPFLHVALSLGWAVLASACSIYDATPAGRLPSAGGAAGAGGGSGTAGAGPSGGGAGSSAAGNGGDSGGPQDAAILDGDATRDDIGSPPDAWGDNVTDSASPGTDGAPSTSDALVDSADASDDVATSVDALDASPPLDDAPFDAPGMLDADAPAADASKPDADAGGPTGPQILPMHGAPIQKLDAGSPLGPFDSRCASNEVVTGFVGRAGVQTDAIAATCSKLVGSTLSAAHNLALNGNASGGSAFTVVCPANYVAVSVVGRYGHNTMWMEDVTTMIGVVCKDLGSSSTQTVTITGQPALDAGYTTFREDCTGGRYLTDLSGRVDSNSLGVTVQQVGGECDLR